MKKYQITSKDIKIEIANFTLGKEGPYYNYDSEIYYDIFHKETGIKIGEYVKCDYEGQCLLGPLQSDDTDYIWEQLIEEFGIDEDTCGYDYWELPEEQQKRFDELYEEERRQMALYWVESANDEEDWQADFIEMLKENFLKEYDEDDQVVVKHDGETYIFEWKDVESSSDVSKDEKKEEDFNKIKEFFKTFTHDDVESFGKYFRNFKIEKVFEDQVDFGHGYMLSPKYYVYGTMDVVKSKGYGYYDENDELINYRKIIGTETEEFKLEIDPETMTGTYYFSKYNKTTIEIK